MKIACDVDGVLYRFQKTYAYMLRTYRNVDVPAGDSWWDSWDAQLKYGSEEDHAWMWGEGVRKGLFRYGHLVTGARIGLEELTKDGHEVVIVTSRPANAVPDTVAWIDTMLSGIDYTGLHILSAGEDKTSVPFDLLIDDRPENIEDAILHGRRTVLFDQPWNQDANWLSDYTMHEGEFTRAKGWDGVVQVIRDQG